MPDQISFIGEIIKVEAKTSLSRDKVARITIETNDTSIMECGTWPSNECVAVEVRRDSIKR